MTRQTYLWPENILMTRQIFGMTIQIFLWPYKYCYDQANIVMTRQILLWPYKYCHDQTNIFRLNSNASQCSGDSGTQVVIISKTNQHTFNYEQQLLWFDQLKILPLLLCCHPLISWSSYWSDSYEHHPPPHHHHRDHITLIIIMIILINLTEPDKPRLRWWRKRRGNPPSGRIF